MEYQSITEIYDSNQKIRGKLVATIGPLTEEQANALPEGEKWTIAEIAEHVAMVTGGIQQICSKLLSKAEAAGHLSDGAIDMSRLAAGFVQATETKLQAPERVHPTGEKSIADSLKALDAAGAAMRELQPMFEKYDGNIAKFPHPYFGDLSALEWLALAGGHEARHTRQIRNLLAKIS